jgi:hypothetical protein
MLGMLRHGLRSRSCIIDGEAVACDDNGVASFDLVRHQRANESIFLYAFDLIELNGDDLRRDPLEVRKATLASIVAKASPGIRFNEHMEGDGPTVFAHACKLGLEGVVSKRKDSAYRSGRSPDWLKMKCGARFDSQRCNSWEIFVARPLKFSHSQDPQPTCSGSPIRSAHRFASKFHRHFDARYRAPSDVLVLPRSVF